MRRRIFAGFAASICLSALLTGAVVRLWGWPWSGQEERLRSYISGEFALSWDHPEARLAHARRIHETLGLRLRLLSPDGRILDELGPSCHQPYEVSVRRDGALLGRVQACYAASPSGWKLLASGATLLLFLWVFAGKLARRLVRPLAEVARVAEALGKGDLEARASLPREHGELAEVAVALNRMAERIERQLLDQRALLAAVSHEIRTPLSRMRFLVERLRAARDPAALQALEAEVLEIDDLVGELLAGSRIDFGAVTKQRLEPVPIVLGLLERLGVPPERLVVEGEDRVLSADPTLLRRALTNLVQNAQRHGGGLDQISLEFEAGLVRFCVLDRGPGFSPAQAETLFAPFRGGGAEGSIGLGLALVRQIAVAHGGRVTAENREPEGARLVLELPRD